MLAFFSSFWCRGPWFEVVNRCRKKKCWRLVKFKWDVWRYNRAGVRVAKLVLYNEVLLASRCKKRALPLPNKIFRHCCIVCHQTYDALIVPLVWLLLFLDLLLIGWDTAAYNCAQCLRPNVQGWHVHLLTWLHSLSLNYHAGLQLKVRERGGSTIQLLHCSQREWSHSFD